jgi:hypothetical protein
LEIYTGQANSHTGDPMINLNITDFKRIQREVEEWLEKQTRTFSQEQFERYYQGTNNVVATKSLGLGTQVIRASLKAPLEVNNLSDEFAAKAWHHIFICSESVL